MFVKARAPAPLTMATAAVIPDLGSAMGVQVIPVPVVVHPSERREGADGEPDEA